MLLAALGGTLITNVVILGQPASWMTADAVLPTYMLVFALDRWLPYDLFHKTVTIGPLFWCVSVSKRTSATHKRKRCIGVLDNVSWATGISAWGAAKALSAEHVRARSSVMATLISGFFSGCGGGLLHSAFCLTDREWKFRCPAGLANNGSFAVRISVFLSGLFYLLTNPHSKLPYEPILSAGDARVVLFLCIFLCDSVYAPDVMRRFAKLGPATPRGPKAKKE